MLNMLRKVFQWLKEHLICTFNQVCRFIWRSLGALWTWFKNYIFEAYTRLLQLKRPALKGEMSSKFVSEVIMIDESRDKTLNCTV